uniref:BTB domain-containing protein n=1 Tax=Ciona savignyi TaxID=51511 RepID=H2YBA8_CIOSA
MFVDDDLFADVVFHLDDGAIRGHKVLLSSGCDVMMAMFAGRFIESENKEVDLPDTTCESFHSILEFIYTNQLPYMDRCSTVNDIIKLANRLCLPELISRLCSIVIGIIESEEERYLDKLAITKLCDDVVMMLQISELHNAPELKQWCLYFLSVHYNDACRNIPKIMKGLPTHILTYLEEHRWPPVWFIKQRDVYEKSLHQRKEQIGRKSRK